MTGPEFARLGEVFDGDCEIFSVAGCGQRPNLEKDTPPRSRPTQKGASTPPAHPVPGKVRLVQADGCLVPKHRRIQKSGHASGKTLGEKLAVEKRADTIATTNDDEMPEDRLPFN